MALGLERQKLDDLLELITMATPPADSNDDGSSFTDWNKLVALAAGQLGHVCIHSQTYIPARTVKKIYRKKSYKINNNTHIVNSTWWQNAISLHQSAPIIYLHYY